MLAYLDAALSLGGAAGALLLSGAGRSHAADSKSSAADLVTRYDRAAEELIVEGLKARFPDHRILAEEGGERAGDPAAPLWIVDPLDGTTNFAHGLPYFAVSIACQVDGVVEVGAIVAPALGWTFAARRGAGAHQNGEVLHVSRTAALSGALLATGFPYDRRTSKENNFAQFERFQRAAQGVRRFGSAALDLCLCASGHLDGYWEMKLKPWDIAAGSLLVQEAGGRVTCYSGAPCDLSRGEILASNGCIHEEMIQVLAGG